jgi:hypothetical protein
MPRIEEGAVFLNHRCFSIPLDKLFTQNLFKKHSPLSLVEGKRITDHHPQKKPMLKMAFCQALKRRKK